MFKLYILVGLLLTLFWIWYGRNYDDEKPEDVPTGLYFALIAFWPVFLMFFILSKDVDVFGKIGRFLNKEREWRK